MDSEIIICPRCKTEITLNYGDKWAINELSIVSQTRCKCSKTIQNPKALDVALKRMQNEINFSGPSGVPKIS